MNCHYRKGKKQIDKVLFNSIDFNNNYRILKQFGYGRRRLAIFRTKKGVPASY